ICIVTFFVASWVLGRQGKQQSEDENTGGRQLSDKPKEVARQMKRDGMASDIKVGDLPILLNSEIQNFCLHGTVGSGKSEVIRRLLNYVRARGDMAIIYDRSCEFVKSYYDPSLDKILNPLDSRCAAWDLWKECLSLPDFDNISNTLIPMGTKEDPFWQGSGRTIFAEGAYLMREDKDRSYEKLVDTMLSIKIDKLRAYLQNTPAANLVEEKIEKTAISIRAVLTNYVKAIRYLQGIEKNGEPFTIRDWMRGVREDRPNGWLFISSNADTHASLKPVISMWLSIAIRGLLAMGENRNRRVWIFADELPTLHKLPDLVEILPEARKFGGCYVFGIQSYAQLEDIYGVKPAATLFDVMNTRAFFRSPSKEIAEFAAGEIGEKEILKASEQYSYGADPVRDGVSTGKEKERETLVSYSDIQTLPDLSCYVTLPGPYPAVKLALKYKPRPKIAEGFIQRSLDTRVDTRLSALLEAREAEGSLARALFTPDAPAPEPAEKDVKVGNTPEQSQPAESIESPATVKAPATAKTPAADETGQSPETSEPAAPVTKVVTVPLIRPRSATATGTAAVATTAASTTSATTVPAGGTEQELAQQPTEQGQDRLPAGMNDDGVIEDMDAYDAWLAGEQTQRDMQ
ncbi:TPA: type IV conjugative transfer system coupling protein TraD, partial [Raoultella ornithinolytica]|nr:type IV conjugative transfer system coupling protein TraD [Raoultella ornithinolytica]